MSNINYNDLNLRDFRDMSNYELLTAYDDLDINNLDLYQVLCERADMEDAWADADGDTFEQVAADAYDKVRELATPAVTKIRKMTGLSMVAFAKRFGIPYRTIQGWESLAPNAHRDAPDYVLDLLRDAVERDHADRVIGKAVKYVLVNEGRGVAEEKAYERLSDAMADFDYFGSRLTKADHSTIYVCTRECELVGDEWLPGAGDDLTVIAEYTPAE